MFEKIDCAIGTSLQGYICVSHRELVKIFGKHHGNDGYKVDAEWFLRFDDGTVATIYNYKDGRNYCGGTGKSIRDIVDWHVGGYNKDAVKRVREALGV